MAMQFRCVLCGGPAEITRASDGSSLRACQGSCPPFRVSERYLWPVIESDLRDANTRERVRQWLAARYLRDGIPTTVTREIWQQL